MSKKTHGDMIKGMCREILSVSHDRDFRRRLVSSGSDVARIGILSGLVEFIANWEF